MIDTKSLVKDIDDLIYLLQAVRTLITDSDNRTPSPGKTALEPEIDSTPCSFIIEPNLNSPEDNHVDSDRLATR